MDPYQRLGVSRSSSEAEIKSAYRKLAKKLHPDMNPGRKDIEQKFKDVTAAYDLLSDKAKRARYDRGEIDENGNEKPVWRGGFGGREAPRSRSRPQDFSSGFDPDDLLSEFFGRRKKGFGGFGDASGGSTRGADVAYGIDIPFTEACLGGKRRVTLSSGKTIDVTIPPGTADGHKLRLRGLGQPGHPAGDALVEIHVQTHPFFVREGEDIHLEAPVSLGEAVLGGSVKVPTLSGPVVLKVHKGASSGAVMRLRGKGIPRPDGGAGDMLVKLKVVLPDDPQALEALAASVEKWSKKYAYDPRKKTGW